MTTTGKRNYMKAKKMVKILLGILMKKSYVENGEGNFT